MNTRPPEFTNPTRRTPPDTAESTLERRIGVLTPFRNVSRVLFLRSVAAGHRRWDAHAEGRGFESYHPLHKSPAQRGFLLPKRCERIALQAKPQAGAVRVTYCREASRRAAWVISI